MTAEVQNRLCQSVRLLKDITKKEQSTGALKILQNADIGQHGRQTLVVLKCDARDSVDG